jgi:hypothetical protein
MRWWQFAQNNSGGSFAGPAHLVFVEAQSADEADDIAKDHGMYFDGCSTGNDCPCCGDRWSNADEPYYSMDDKLVIDESLYLVPTGQPGALVRTEDGNWVTEHEALVERARQEIDAQIAERNKR